MSTNVEYATRCGTTIDYSAYINSTITKIYQLAKVVEDLREKYDHAKVFHSLQPSNNDQALALKKISKKFDRAYLRIEKVERVFRSIVGEAKYSYYRNTITEALIHSKKMKAQRETSFTIRDSITIPDDKKT